MSKTTLKPAFEAVVHTIADYTQVINRINSLPKRHKWVFRGVPVATWAMLTSLDRALMRYDEQGDARNIEYYILREFKRRAHHYLAWLPEDNNALEWLALMQHHGAPTRLLDWTYSFFIATYFALELAGDSEESAVWGINTSWCTARTEDKLTVSRADRQWRKNRDHWTKRPETFDKYLVNKARPCVCPIAPLKLNERITIQQGLFLCAGDNTVTFEQNLKALGDPLRNLLRITIHHTIRAELLRELNRMNITSAVLFPGLDGFSRSLHTMPAFKERWADLTDAGRTYH